ncbi:hypothetical protein [Providencia huaxiensis]|uniref:Uncharacterized protein n=1 Tax=Providencia huaxiensis TaxID=2027290 RepID=A0A345LV39_9GAMM|nr:hypothetical protein [Providencia huaxiensis]MBZ3682822.1 hypothetical protein [Providencia rettgeri]AXH61979.1 hypothetical protein CYG50_08080 [Providencia huaxiensis]MBN6363534.1 hypothetical protein [Providencia huaxiensis]MBQ0269684.1 hypothetical protein [Providencia huaxiensis]MBQ0534682.1 hypothetical protein [Providencia huaxiensis]
MNIIKLLTILLLAGSSFILGVTLNYSPKPDLVKMAKSSVEDYLSFPESASFRNVKYNFIRQTTDKGELGYVCGEVFRIKNARLEGYKKFIMKAYSDKQGKVSLSIPMVEGDYDLMPKEMVDSLWTRYCF